MVRTNSKRKGNDINMKKKILIFLILQLLVLQKSFSENSDLYKKIDLFGEVLEKINEEYVDDVNKSKSIDAAINGLLQSLDPYSAYMTPESFESMQTETSGEFGGLGIEVGMETGIVKVISPIDNTPASKAGIKAGDYIQLGSASSSSLHKVLADANSDGSGEVVLDIWPNINVAQADNATIVTSNAKGVWRLANNESNWSINEIAVYGLTFGCTQAIV